MYYIGDRLAAVFHTRLRLSNSTLNYDLYLKNFVSSPSCACGFSNETAAHIFFDCDRYAAPCDTLLTSAALLLGARWTNATNKTSLKCFLNGMSCDVSFQTNARLFPSVQNVIVDSGRFACGRI